MDMEGVRYMPNIPNMDSSGTDVGTLGALLPMHRASYTEARCAHPPLVTSSSLQRYLQYRKRLQASKQCERQEFTSSLT